MKSVLGLALLSFSSLVFAAECSWNDNWTWGEFRTVQKGSSTQVTLKGSQLSALSKEIDLTGDAWTVVAGLRFNIPAGAPEFHACMPVEILEMNNSVLATKRLNFTYKTYAEGDNTIVHLIVQNRLDEKLLFESGDCQ